MARKAVGAPATMDIRVLAQQRGTDREFLLAIQPTGNGLFDRLFVRGKVDGY
ncbi:MAG: hypothetical protein U0231_11300 [Nitrospiraceae bacterium]